MTVKESIEFGYREMRTRCIVYLYTRKRGEPASKKETRQFHQFREDTREHIRVLNMLKKIQ